MLLIAMPMYASRQQLTQGIVTIHFFIVQFISKDLWHDAELSSALLELLLRRCVCIFNSNPKLAYINQEVASRTVRPAF